MASTDEWAKKLFDIARQCTGYYHPYLETGSHSLYDVLLPHVQSCQETARYFQCRGNFEFAQGHYEQAMECMFASVRMGRTMQSGSGTCVEHLVGIAMTGMGSYQLTTYLANLPKEKDAAWFLQMKKEYDAIETAIPVPWLPKWHQFERYMPLALIQLTAAEPKVFDEFFREQSRCEPNGDEMLAKYDKLFNAGIEYDWNEILKQVNAFYDDWEEVLLIPNWQRRLRAATRLEQRVVEYSTRNVDSSDSPERRATDFLLGTFGTSTGATMYTLVRTEWRGLVASVAFSLAAYRADHNGESPDTLEQLVPKYLAEVPLSPYTDKPLRYIKRPHDVLIANDDEYLFDGSEEEVEKKISEAKSGEFAYIFYQLDQHCVFVAAK